MWRDVRILGVGMVTLTMMHFMELSKFSNTWEKEYMASTLPMNSTILRDTAKFLLKFRRNHTLKVQILASSMWLLYFDELN